QFADSLVLAGLAAQAVLAMQAHASPGALATELEEGADFRFVVHQASGMVAVQLGVSVGEALVRLRAYAFGNDRLLGGVAEATGRGYRSASSAERWSRGRRGRAVRGGGPGWRWRHRALVRWSVPDGALGRERPEGGPELCGAGRLGDVGVGSSIECIPDGGGVTVEGADDDSRPRRHEP